MKILFIQPDIPYGEGKKHYNEYGNYYLGVSYLSSILKAAGHQTGLIHITQPVSQKEFLKKIESFSPDLIGFSFFTHYFHYTKELINYIDKRWPVICGGVHTTIAPDEVLQCPGVDMICIGEGEKMIVELCERLESKTSLKRLKGLWFKEDGKIIKNHLRFLNNDLDTLPFPDRSIFNYPLILKKMKKLDVLGARGCPFKCTYCIEHQYRRMLPRSGKFIRYRSVENVINEIEEVHGSYPFGEYVELLDDTFGINDEWVAAFCSAYKKLNIGIPFYANTHINVLSGEKIKILKEGGCKRLALGIESGDAYIREKILKRATPDNKIYEIFNACKKYGIETVSYNIVGIPFETPVKALKTIKLNAKIEPTMMHVAILQPYPYTDIHALCIKEGFLYEKKVSSFFKESVLNLPGFSKQDIRFSYLYFNVFVRAYSLSQRFPKTFNSLFGSLLDRIFLEPKIHPLLIFLYPVVNIITRIRGRFRNV